MTPTQAQIDAALRAYSEAGAGHKGGMIAALTAAAEVGEQYVPKNDPRLDEVVGGPKKKRIGFAGAIDEAIAKEVAATIERCAQVAESHERKDKQEAWSVEIAAAIRALATEAK